MDVLLSKSKTPVAKPEGLSAQTGEDEGSAFKSGMDKGEIAKAINRLVTENSDEDGWYFMGTLGSQLLGKYPDFDPRNFGFAKLTQFVKSLGGYEFRADAHPTAPNMKLVYIRPKRESQFKKYVSWPKDNDQ